MICAKCSATVTSWRVVDGATLCMACSKDVPMHEEQIAALRAEVARLTAEKAADFATLSAANAAAKAENDKLRAENDLWRESTPRIRDAKNEAIAEIARLKADVAALIVDHQRFVAGIRGALGTTKEADDAHARILARTEPK